MSEDFSNVETEQLLVDRASINLIRRPEEFDVVVASNLFGDITTDLATVITGGLDLTPSGNINPDGNFLSMFKLFH